MDFTFWVIMVLSIGVPILVWLFFLRKLNRMTDRILRRAEDTATAAVEDSIRVAQDPGYIPDSQVRELGSVLKAWSRVSRVWGRSDAGEGSGAGDREAGAEAPEK